MIFSDFTYNSVTFHRFIRTSGYMASVIRGDRIQIRTTKDGLPSQDGIQRYIDYYGSRLMEVNGFIKGSSEIDLYNKINALQDAFDIHKLESIAEYGFAPLEWTDPGQETSRYYLKPLGNTLIISEDRTGLSRRFSVLMEAKDPVKYLSAEEDFTVMVSDTDGSSNFPVGFPVAFGGVKNTGTGTVTNAGSSAIYPRYIRLYAVTATWIAPKITNVTTGDYTGFTGSVLITVGQYVEINPSLGSVRLYSIDGTSVDISSYLLAGSTFWKYNSGDNITEITGSSVGESSYASIKLNSQF